MNRKEPWEGYRRQAKRVSPVVSFPPSFARTFSSKERRLGTRQSQSLVDTQHFHFGSEVLSFVATELKHSILFLFLIDALLVSFLM